MDVYDKVMAMKRAGGSLQLAEQIFGMLRADLPQLQQDIEKAYSQQQHAELRRLVHKIVGATRYCGVPGLADSAEVLDKYLKAGQSEKLTLLLQHLYEEIDRVLKYTP